MILGCTSPPSGPAGEFGIYSNTRLLQPNRHLQIIREKRKTVLKQVAIHFFLLNSRNPSSMPR